MFQCSLPQSCECHLLLYMFRKERIHELACQCLLVSIPAFRDFISHMNSKFEELQWFPWSWSCPRRCSTVRWCWCYGSVLEHVLSFWLLQHKKQLLQSVCDFLLEQTIPEVRSPDHISDEAFEQRLFKQAFLNMYLEYVLLVCKFFFMR